MSAARPLTVEDVPHLHLRFDSIFTRAGLQEHVRDYPTLAWTNEQREYAVAGRWKSREDVIELLEVGGPGSGLRGLVPSAFRDTGWPDRRSALIVALLGAARDSGRELVLLSERETERNLAWYAPLGFEIVEDIVFYHKPNVLARPTAGRLTLRPLHFSGVPCLMQLEQRVFPWLWWYGADEWYMIGMLADVETNLAYLDDRLVGYETHTVRGTHGHLDRLGVDPAMQGQHLGSELLLHATHRIGELGARSIGLSTQRNNMRARHLYEKYGFRMLGRTLRYYGKFLAPSARAALGAPSE